LLKVRKVQKIGIVLLTSDKGLCGSYNSAVIKKVIDQIKNPHSLMANRVMDRKIESDIDPNDLQLDFICIGKKGAEVMRKLNKKVSEVFTGMKDRPKLKDIKPISTLIISEYSRARYDKIVVAYNDFQSTIRQVPKLRQLLPISEIDLEKIIAGLDINNQDDEIVQEKAVNKNYVYEPGKNKLLETLLRKLVEMQLYQLILEASASEHCARMLAMKNASEAANEMIDELKLIFNKARQSIITQEIAEISSGRAALENL